MMKTLAWIGIFFAFVAVVAASGHSESSCSLCSYYERCYPCAQSSNVWCSDSLSYNAMCCTSNIFYVRYCTGSGCCSLTGRILMYLGIAAGVVAVFVGAFLIFWCIRTRRNRIEYGGFQQTHSEVVEVHHYDQPQYGTTVTQTQVGTPAAVGYQAPVGYQAAPGYTY